MKVEIRFQAMRKCCSRTCSSTPSMKEFWEEFWITEDCVSCKVRISRLGKTPRNLKVESSRHLTLTELTRGGAHRKSITSGVVLTFRTFRLSRLVSKLRKLWSQMMDMKSSRLISHKLKLEELRIVQVTRDYWKL